MRDLVVDIYGRSEHARDTMTRLGISYFHAVPQSVGDCWWFFNCRNIPDDLPENVKVRDFGDLNKLVGFGLGEDDVRRIYADRGFLYVPSR